jgi:septal ring-binding cell division protein DamX
MKKQLYRAGVLATIATLSLSSCQSYSELWPDNSWGDPSSQRPSKQRTTMPVQKATPPSASSSNKSGAGTVSKKGVVLPPTYYLAEGTPVSHQSSDNTWVETQSSSGYTIQLAEDSSAPAVAQTLQKAPKNARMAQVQYNNNGKSNYVGVYGTYATKEEADAALAKLPATLQSSAKVESWGSVQEKTISSSANTMTSSIALPDVTNMSE